MSTPEAITNLINNVSPKSIEAFCRLKFPMYDFERCRSVSDSYFEIDYSVDKTDVTRAAALRQFSDAVKDGRVTVIGRFKPTGPEGGYHPILVYSVPMKGSITSRSSKKKQADFAKFVLDVAETDIFKYKPDWSVTYRIGLFFFHDEDGNFRLSLIFTTEKRFRRFTYFVEKGMTNRTFRYRMTNTDNEKAAKGEVEQWKCFLDVKKAFSVEELTKEFYNELFAWYERAVASPDVIFPSDTAKRKEGETEGVFRERVKSEQVIRLITRLLFVWFIKQKKLVPDELFDPWKLREILKSFSEKEGDNYYRAILQNLFFATLNSEIGSRDFAANGSWNDNREHFDIKTLYRYQEEFAIPKADVLKLFRSIPFLNGGLFECLDRGREYFDGFSRNKAKVAHVPNAFFFDDNEKTLGLIPLLQRYNFTIDENAHDDQDIALDPELLGKVFENLLGAFNPETSTTARKATGSFYTPREIVNYMVDESLIAYLMTKMQGDGSDQDDARRAQDEKVLRELFNDGIRPADEKLCQTLDKALTTAKILDPACGSGAFPMGMLLRMVELLRILRQMPDDDSPENLKKLYELKLELIENCIYGVDIQCIAVQISKLRFFISLVCEQTPTGDTKTNFGINPLPNLETKFVAADSLIGLPKVKEELPGFDTANIGQLKEDLWDIRHRHFQARTYRDKKKLRQEDEDKRKEIKEAITKAIAPNLERLAHLEAERAKIDEPDWQVREKPREDKYLFTEMTPEVRESTPSEYDANARRRSELDKEIALEKKKQNTPATQIDTITRQLTEWNPYDQNASSPYFDPEWMFNVTEGFDIVIGNPPYINVELVSPSQKMVYKENYTTIYKRYDVFGLFFEASLLRYTCKNGKVSFIVPQQIANNLSYKKLRNLMLDNAWIHEILYLGDDVFEGPNNDVCVVILSKPSCQNIRLVYALDFENRKTSIVPNDYFKKYDNVISFGNNMKGETIFEKIFSKNRKKIKDDFTVFQGIVTGNNDAFIPTPNQIAEAKIEPELLHTVLLGRDFEKWAIRNTERKIIYVTGNTDLTLTPNTEKWLLNFKLQLMERRECRNGTIPWYSLQWPRVQSELDRAPKIMVQGTRNPRLTTRIVATMDEQCVYGTQGINFIVPLEPSAPIYFLLAVLNSRLINYLYATKFLNVAIKAEYLKDTPIPKASKQDEEHLSDLAHRILSAKKANPSADTSKLEAEIDQIVYRLYGLTPEEIAIVENATAKALAESGKKDRKGAAVRVKSAGTDGKASGGKASKSATAAASPPEKPAPSRRGRPPRQEPGIEI